MKDKHFTSRMLTCAGALMSKRVDCPRHGDCAACREHHYASDRKPLTRCEKLARKEQRKAR